MFQQPLEQTRSLPQVEDIFVSLSPRPRLTLNRCSEWWSIGCWLRTSQYKWHPRPMPCHLWREMTSLHLVFCRRHDRGRLVREWSEGQMWYTNYIRWKLHCIYKHEKDIYYRIYTMHSVNITKCNSQITQGNPNSWAWAASLCYRLGISIIFCIIKYVIIVCM